MGRDDKSECFKLHIFLDSNCGTVVQTFLRTSGSNVKHTLEALEVLTLKGQKSIQMKTTAYPWGYDEDYR